MGGMKDLLGDTPYEELKLPSPPPSTPYPDGIPQDICRHFEALALQVKAQGHNHYSSDAILHRIRWHMHIERGLRDFKCNDHWTAPLSRWLMARHRHMAGFFETRKSPEKDRS